MQFLCEIVLIAICQCIILVSTFDPLRRQLASVPHTPLQPSDDPGQPLFLTPYIESGHIDQARNLSRVDLQPDYAYSSYSGYLT
ncbi:unnamed protein product, partial [Adineta ricciae]